MKKKVTELFLITALIVGIYYLGFTGELKLLINPKYYLLVTLSIFFLLLLIASIVSSKIHSSKFKILKSKYILVIVIIFLMFTTSYSNYQEVISDSRGITIGDDVIYDMDTGNSTQQYDTDSMIPEIPIYYEDNIVVDDLNFFNVIDSLYVNTDFYQGKSVTMKGFVYNIDGLNENKFVIARMTMLCCAADSSIFGLFCDMNGVEYNFVKNNWYEITGTIQKEEIKLNSETGFHPVIHITDFQALTEPDEPYVYPTF